MKAATVALVVSSEGGQPSLVEIISDDREIHLLESALTEGEKEPLKRVYEQRQKVAREEEEFGDYVEQLLCKPFLRREIQDHGVQWLKSKIRIEQYQRNEAEAAKIIAQYALKVFQENPARREFWLAGPSAQVKIRIFAAAAERAAAS